MSKIKIGQIGVGHAHAAGKMLAFRQSPDFEVVGVVESNEQRRHQADRSATYKDLPWLTQEQLLNLPGLKVVAVETDVPNLLNAAQTCIAAGKHIHLDKPAGASLEQFKKILDEADRKHLLIQMGYMYRYNPAVVLLRDFLRKGWLGEPFELHAVMSKQVGPKDRAGLAAFRGGILFELGCHIMDLAIGILGEPERVTGFSQSAEGFADGLNDNMLAVLTYPQAIATVKSSALEVEGFSRRHLVVCGTEGTFQMEPLDAPSVRCALSRPRDKYAKGVQTIALGKYTRYVDDVADMAKVIRGEKASDYPSGHDYAVQKALLQTCGMA